MRKFLADLSGFQRNYKVRLTHDRPPGGVYKIGGLAAQDQNMCARHVFRPRYLPARKDLGGFGLWTNWTGRRETGLGNRDEGHVL